MGLQICSHFSSTLKKYWRKLYPLMNGEFGLIENPFAIPRVLARWGENREREISRVLAFPTLSKMAGWGGIPYLEYRNP